LVRLRRESLRCGDRLKGELAVPSIAAWLLGLRDNAKIRLGSLPPLGIEPLGFVV
jgi:hypothetical protein